jgi:2-keto-4-pentenoate hydratase
MPMNKLDVERWAEALDRARRDRIAIEPLTATEPQLGLSDAYAIAQRGLARRLDDGARLVGHKLGLTSVAVQKQLGVDQPDYGGLLDDMVISSGASVPADLFIAPRVELEFAFHLSDRLAGPGIAEADVLAATKAVQPAIEIVDSRIVDWRITLADTVADNASSGAFVLGGESLAASELDPSTAVQLNADGDLLEQGRADAVLGNPLRAVAWLANTLAAFGAELAAGQIVLSGACTRMAPALPGATYVGDFGRFGTVEVNFEERS